MHGLSAKGAKAGIEKRTPLTILVLHHPPLLFDQIIFFVLIILNFLVFPMFKSLYLVMWTKSFKRSALLYLHL